MRKVICLLIAMLFVFCAAQAEEYFGTRKDDLYYHTNLNCGGADGMVPITAHAAGEFTKYPCPVCIQDDTEWAEGIAAVARGNTVIVRMADSWLEEAELTDVFGFSSPDIYPLSEAAEQLTEYLHGDRYNGFLQEIQQDGASTIARVPYVGMLDRQNRSILIMSRRHIGNAWYIVFRPEDALGDNWDMYWRINGMEIKTRVDSFYINFKLQTLDAEYPLVTPQFYDPAAFSAQYDGCKIDVFADAGQDVHANAAVITQFNADKDYMKDCTLFIADRVRIPINGYMSGTDGIFCCTLTQAEYEYLKSGAKASIQIPSILERANFDNGKYAAVRKGTGGVGIIDANGTFIIQPVFKNISGTHIDTCPTTVPAPFFCEDADGTLTILDGETLNVIAKYAPTNQYMNAAYQNPAVFWIQDGRGMRILSLETGDLLFEIPYGADGNYINGVTEVDGRYRCVADGMPDRLVLRGGDGDRLITNAGEAVSDIFSRITPLIWKGNQGVFLVEMWDSIDEELQKAQSFSGGGDEFFARGNVLSAPAVKLGWRCGLMNQRGEIIAPIEYSSIEVTDDLKIILGGTDCPTTMTIE